MPQTPPSTPAPTVAASSGISLQGPYTLAAGQELYFTNTNGFSAVGAVSQAPAFTNDGTIILKSDDSQAVAIVSDNSSTGVGPDTFNNDQGSSMYVEATGANTTVYGFYGQGGASTATNAGLIQVVATGDSATVFGIDSILTDFAANNTGTLTAWSSSGAATGIQSTSGGDIRNAGSITVTGGSQATGIRVNNFGQSLNNAAGRVLNSGSIDVTEFPPINSVGIDVLGGGGAGAIVNTGTINAYTAIRVEPRNAYDFSSSPTVAISNAGVIDGIVDLGNSSSTFVNTGTLDGSVDAGYGDVTIDSRLGGITGAITIDAQSHAKAIHDTIQLGSGNPSVRIAPGSSLLTVDLTGSSGSPTTSFSAAAETATIIQNANGTWTALVPDSGEVTTNGPASFAFDDYTVFTAAIGSIDQGFETIVGRAPTQAELNYWEARVVGPDLAYLVTQGLVSTAEGQAYTQARITALYDSYFGRDPSHSEIAVWQGLLANGSDYGALRSALVSDSAGKSYAASEIGLLYDANFGRDPTSSELSVWQGLIATGSSFADLRGALLAEPAGQEAAAIASLYDTYFGRDPTPQEVLVWRGLIASGASLATLRSALVADAAGLTHTSAETTLLYDTYFGRDPTAKEIGVWQGLVADGADFGVLRAALVSDPAGSAHAAVEVSALYETYFGRDPSAGEVSVWEGLIKGGADFATLRGALLADPAGQAHTVAMVTTLYDTYFGRDPLAPELSAAAVAVVGGLDFSGLRAQLVSDPRGLAHTDATVTSLYDAFFGRDPSAAELGVWESSIASGADFGTVRGALLSDAGGMAHTAAQITSMYDTFFGRDASLAEVRVWEGLFASGAGFDQLQDALERDPGSAGHVHQVSSHGGHGNFYYTGHYETIANFQSASDVVVLSYLDLGIDPLGAPHARQITALDGTNDVLITTDATHSVLLQHTTLASLSETNFTFG